MAGHGAPDGSGADGLRVRILDLSGGAEEGITEEIGGFQDLEASNAFARAYVRDSIERCREPGLSDKQVLEAWHTFGEDAVVLGAGDDAWQSGPELNDFAACPSTTSERDWRSLDPRRHDPDEEDS